MLKLPQFSARFLCVLSLAALFTATAPAQTAPKEYYPSEATGEVLGKYRIALDAKNYEGALAILDAQIPKAEAGSYDLALLYQIKAQTLLQKGDFSESIVPLEKTVALSDAKTPPYFDERVVREFIYMLAQLYYQQAAQSKEPAVAAEYFGKADKVMIRWLKITPKPTPDAYLIHAQILYTWAALNADKPNLDLIKRALEQIEAGMHLVTHPKDTFYILKLVCLQQLGRNVEAAEVLEQIVKQKTDSSTFWQQLTAFYLSTEQPVRAILTYERAQAHGFMNTPKDNLNIVSVYFNLGQFEKSAELLETGLKDGKIENDQKNWELLYFAYQQLERPLKGIESLKDAAKAFPNAGQLDFMIAQAYQGLQQPEAALPYAQAAVKKGGLSKPHQSYMFLAYVAFELKKFDIALAAAKKAEELPEGAKDPQTKNMIKAIEETVKEREARKNKA